MWAVAVCALTAVIVLVQWRRSGQSLVHFVGLGLVRMYARVWHGLTWNGPAPLPAKGPAILIANHTCSADPAFLQAGCRRPLSFLIAREYYRDLPWARRLFDYLGAVPVGRNGRDVAAVRQGLLRLSEGRVLCIFPEGGLHAAGRGRMRRGKGGAALLALRSRAPVYPAFISRGPGHRNVPRAWLLPSRTSIIYGPAVDLSAYYDRPIDRRLVEEVTALLMQRIAELGPPRTNRRRPASAPRRKLP
jgi:1-acyl-sn-glycerol-3-phosphate acyltransferase